MGKSRPRRLPEDLG